VLGLTCGVKNVDNINNVRRATSRHFRNKKMVYLKAKIEELETNSKIKHIRELYRDISGFKKGYQPRTNIVKDKKGDLFTDSHSILARWRDHFSQLFNVHGVRNVRQTKIHAAEPIVPELSVFVVEMPIEKLKGHKSPGIDQIPAELIKAGSRTIRFKILKLITSTIYFYLVYADDNILDESIHTRKKNTEALVVASKENGLDVNADRTMYMVLS